MNDVGQVDGAAVSFSIDAEHVIADRDTRPTECPGDYLYGKIPWIIDEALRRYEERHPETPEPGDHVSLARADAERMAADAEFAAAKLREALG
jgi:hypothetical protein